MKKCSFITLLFLMVSLPVFGHSPALKGNMKGKIEPGKDFGKIPLYFIPNKGQADQRVLFYARTSTYTLWLTSKGLIFESFQSHTPDISSLLFMNANQDPVLVPEIPSTYKVHFLKGSKPSSWSIFPLLWLYVTRNCIPASI